MFSFTKLAAIVTLATLAVATPVPDAGAGSCNTGPIQCCNSVQTADSSTLASLGGLLGVVLPTVEGLIGLDCSPITAIGLASSSCSAAPVCCTNNSYGSLVSLGCAPITV